MNWNFNLCGRNGRELEASISQHHCYWHADKPPLTFTIYILDMPTNWAAILLFSISELTSSNPGLETGLRFLMSFLSPYRKLMKYLLAELIPSWESLTVQPLKNFPAYYGTRRFNTVFTWALHWSLSIQSTPSHPISLRSILILSTRSSTVACLSRFLCLQQLLHGGTPRFFVR
jgi:hypothetical protein